MNSVPESAELDILNGLKICLESEGDYTIQNFSYPEKNFSYYEKKNLI